MLKSNQCTTSLTHTYGPTSTNTYRSILHVAYNSVTEQYNKVY